MALGPKKTYNVSPFSLRIRAFVPGLLIQGYRWLEIAVWRLPRTALRLYHSGYWVAVKELTL